MIPEVRLIGFSATFFQRFSVQGWFSPHLRHLTPTDREENVARGVYLPVVKPLSYFFESSLLDGYGNYLIVSKKKKKRPPVLFGLQTWSFRNRFYCYWVPGGPHYRKLWFDHHFIHKICSERIKVICDNEALNHSKEVFHINVLLSFYNGSYIFDQSLSIVMIK